MSKVSAWENALSQLTEAAQKAGLDAKITEMLSEPQRVLIVNFPVRMDNGDTKFFKGYRVHHNHALGQIQGGTRFHQDETLDDMKALSLWMTIKNALNGLPAGGGKGGVCCDSTALSRGELERVCRGYIRAIAPVMGANTDFPGADVGTSTDTQSWMLDEWEQLHAMRHEPSAVSGKAMILGGSQGRIPATGLGVGFAVRETCKVLGKDIKGLKVAIQGFGKVGYWTARTLAGFGAVIVAVSDVCGGVYSENGLDIGALKKYSDSVCAVGGFPDVGAIDNKGLLACDCDVLVPAAVQNVITPEVVSKIKAKIIVEGANGPTTQEAERSLLERGVMLVPDILANGGGTTIAYLERVQGTYGLYWNEKEVHERYEEMFVKTYHNVYRTSKEENISMRMAAWVLALRKVEEAIKTRGWV